MSFDYVLSHTVAIHITATSSTALSSSNKADAATKFTVTDTVAFETKKYLNSAGYDSNIPVWNSLSGSIEFDRKTGSAVQDVISAAFAARAPFYISVITDPGASAGSQGKRYTVYAETDPKEFEGGTILKANIGLKFDGAPVDI